MYRSGSTSKALMVHVRFAEDDAIRELCPGEWAQDYLTVPRSLSSKIRMIKSRKTSWAGHVARMGEKRIAYRILVGKPEGTARRRWEDNIKMDLRQNEMLCTGMIWLRIGTSRGLLRTR
jgi:hypothetical protein